MSDQRLTQVQRQELKLSPQQIQLMKLLQLPLIELEQRIKEEIESNPALEDSINSDENESTAEERDNTDDNEPVAVSHFITRFKEVIESRLEDSNVSVEDLAADMNLSRVQLYRKVKAVSGASPVELLRTARLNRAYQLLLTSDKSVSEVAYAVGFTAPSYFTKCFKEEYGMVPGDVRK